MKIEGKLHCTFVQKKIPSSSVHLALHRQIIWKLLHVLAGN